MIPLIFKEYLQIAIDNNKNKKETELELRFKGLTKGSFYNLANNNGKDYMYIKDEIYPSYTKRYVFLDKKIKKKFESINITYNDILNYNNNNADIIFQTKQKIKPDIFIKNDIKISLVLETEINIKNPQKTPNLVRHKFRCTWCESVWEYSLTIVFNGPHTILYELEVEFKYNKYKKEKIQELFKDINNRSNKLIEYIKNYKDVEHIIKNTVNSVVTLEESYIPILTSNKYTLTDKADGLRKYAYINGSVLYTFNPTKRDDIFEKIYEFKTDIFNKTVLDCELINGIYHVFDILFYKGKDIRNLILPKRLLYIKKIITEFKKNKNKLFVQKTFYMDDIFKKAKEIWLNKTKKFKYNLDGLIFTPIDGGYNSILPTYKWKDKISIDVYCVVNDNFTEFHSNDHKTIMFKNKKVGTPIKIQAAPTDIVEMEYDNGWKFLRLRLDKNRANAYKTIISSLKAIDSNITIDKLAKLKYVPNI